MAESGSIRAGRAYVELGVDDRTDAGLSKVQQRMAALGAGVRLLGYGFASLGSAIAGPLDASAFAFSEAGAAMNAMSQRTGVSVEALSALSYAADQANVEMTSLETGLKRMQKSLFAAEEGEKEATSTLKSLGLEIRNLQGLSPEDQFRAISEQVSSVADPTQRAAIAMKVFGKSGTDLLPLIEEGARGLDNYRKQAERLGVVMSTRDAAAADGLNDALGALWITIKQTSMELGAALAGPYTELAKQATAIVSYINRWIKAHRELIVTISRTATVLIGVGGALIAAGTAISAFSHLVGGLGGALTGVVGSASKLAGPLGMLETAFDVLASPIRLVIGSLGSLATGVLGLLPKLFGLVASGAGVLTTILGNLGAVALSTGASLASGLGSTLLTIASPLKLVIPLIGVLLDVGTEFLAIVAGLAVLPFGGPLFAALAGGLVLVISPLIQATVIIGGLIAAFFALRGVVAGTAGSLAGAAKGIASSVAGAISTATATVTGAARRVGKTAMGAVEQGMQAGRGPVMKAFGWVREQVAGLGTAISNGPGGVFDWIAQAFGSIKTAVGPAVAWLMEKFGELRTFVGGVVTGISDALSAGEVPLAAEVLWASLRLVWFRGVSELLALWQEHREKILTMAYKGWYGIVAAAAGAWGMIKDGWSDLTSFLSEKWYNFTASAIEVFATMTTSLLTQLADIKEGATKAWNVIQKVMHPIDFKRPAADKAAEDEHKKDIEAIGARDQGLRELARQQRERAGENAPGSEQQAAAQADADAQARKSADLIQQKLQAALDSIGPGAAAGDARLQQMEKALQQAQSELAAAQGRAAAAKAQRDLAEEKKKKELENVANNATDVKTSSAGQFGGLNANGLGTGRELEVMREHLAETKKGTAYQAMMARFLKERGAFA